MIKLYTLQTMSLSSLRGKTLNNRSVFGFKAKKKKTKTTTGLCKANLQRFSQP